jgi:hypothetical protein
LEIPGWLTVGLLPSRRDVLVIQDGTGNAFAAISGTGINFVPGNKMAIGSAAAPYSGMFTITNCVNAPTSSVSVYAATQGVNGRIHIETIQNHGMAVGGVCTISNIVGTTEANGVGSTKLLARRTSN